MKHTLKKLSDTQVEITIAVSAEDMADAKEKALKHLSRDLKAPGFRKGKVPANVAEKHLDPNLLSNEVMQHAVNQTLTETMAVENLRVLDQPNISITKFVPYTDMEFRAVVEIIPEVKLGNYKKLKVKRVVKKVEKSDVDEVVERIRQSLAEKNEVKRAAAMGDEVTIDFVGKKDGEAFDGGTSKDYSLALGSKSFIPGFEEAIVGHKPGDKFDVPLTFPKDYHAESLKGTKVVFEVTLKKVAEVKLPELTDELAKKVGPVDNVKDMLEDIKSELMLQNERQADDRYKDDLIQALVKVSKVPVPEILLTDQTRSIAQDFKQNLMYRGLTPDDYMKQMGYADEAEWQEKEFNELAEKRVKAGLVLAELSKEENVEVTKEELDARQAQMLEQYPSMKEQLNTPESRADLVNRLVTEKTLDRLVQLNS